MKGNTDTMDTFSSGRTATKRQAERFSKTERKIKKSRRATLGAVQRVNKAMLKLSSW